ncbi:MAG: hypothetical protein VCA12_18205, partial [Pseudomonadales bacterium]
MSRTENASSNTRLNRSDQVNGAIGESGSIGDLAGIGVAVCYCFLGAGLAEPGGCPPTCGCEKTSNNMPFYRRKRFIALCIAALLFAWLQFQVPSNEGPWNHAQVRTSWVEFDDRRLTVHNLRDFRYGADLR